LVHWLIRTTAVVQFVSAILLILVSDKVGRRRTTLIATTVCTIAMIVVGVLGFVDKTTAILNLLIFVATVWSFFSKALGSIGWAFVGEVASQRLRARTAGLAGATSVIFGLIFNTTVPLMRKSDSYPWVITKRNS
jgi:MFS transporter, SP family, sugar:H+ symporter